MRITKREKNISRLMIKLDCSWGSVDRCLKVRRSRTVSFQHERIPGTGERPWVFDAISADPRSKDISIDRVGKQCTAEDEGCRWRRSVYCKLSWPGVITRRNDDASDRQRGHGVVHDHRWPSIERYRDDYGNVCCWERERERFVVDSSF